LRTLPLLVPPIQPPSCTPPGFPVFYTCSTLCNVCVVPLPAAIPTAEYIARIARIAPLAPPFHYCAASVHALCWLCLGPLLLCRWRTPCLLPTLTTATLSPARGTPSGARGSGRLLKYCCLLASKSECCMGCRQAACFGWMLGVGVRGARLLGQHHLLHSLGSLGLLL
jgi:hypothetical protein